MSYKRVRCGWSVSSLLAGGEITFSGIRYKDDMSSLTRLTPGLNPGLMNIICVTRPHDAVGQVRVLLSGLQQTQVSGFVEVFDADDFHAAFVVKCFDALRGHDDFSESHFFSFLHSLFRE